MKKLLNGSLAAIAATFVVSACAAESPKPAVRENLVQKTATVEAIDQASRVVKLRTEDGNTSTIVVDPEVRNLPQVKVGDKVVVSYYEALAAEVKKPGEGVKGVEADVSSVRSQPGEKPGGGAGVIMRTTVTIESVDTTFNTVSFKRPGRPVADRRGRVTGRQGVHQGTQERRRGGSSLHRGACHRSQAGRLSRLAGSPNWSAFRGSWSSSRRWRWRWSPSTPPRVSCGHRG